MIELTWGLIRQPQFNEAMQKLIHAPLDFKDSYHIARIASKIEMEQKEADKMFQGLVNKFGETDSEGRYKVKEEHKDDWVKQTTEFVGTKVVIEKSKINMAKFSTIKLTAAEILALEPLFTDDEDGPKLMAPVIEPDFKKTKPTTKQRKN